MELVEVAATTPTETSSRAGAHLSGCWVASVSRRLSQLDLRESRLTSRDSMPTPDGHRNCLTLSGDPRDWEATCNDCVCHVATTTCEEK